MSVAALGGGGPAGAGNHWKGRLRNLAGTSGCGCPVGAAAGGAGRTKFASGFGLSVIVTPGPLSKTPCGEMLSTRQSFSASPSDRTTDFAPFTAKIAMRRSGSITMPLSLTSAGRRSSPWTEEMASGELCVAPCGCSAISRACVPVLISLAGGLLSNKGPLLLVRPRPMRSRPVKTAHPARSKAGKRVITSAQCM